MGDALGARNIYVKVLRGTGEKHIELLVGYGRLALMSNQADKGVSSLLRAIITGQIPWCRLDPCMYIACRLFYVLRGKLHKPLLLILLPQSRPPLPPSTGVHGRCSASLNFTCLSILSSVPCGDFLFGGET